MRFPPFFKVNEKKEFNVTICWRDPMLLPAPFVPIAFRIFKPGDPFVHEEAREYVGVTILVHIEGNVTQAVEMDIPLGYVANEVRLPSWPLILPGAGDDIQIAVIVDVCYGGGLIGGSVQFVLGERDGISGLKLSSNEAEAENGENDWQPALRFHHAFDADSRGLGLTSY